MQEAVRLTQFDMAKHEDVNGFETRHARVGMPPGRTSFARACLAFDRGGMAKPAVSISR